MKRSLPVALVALGLLSPVLPGCTNKVSGKVDGQKVKVVDGYFVQYEYEGFGGMAILLTGVNDACETDAAFYDELSDAADAAEAAEIYASYYPEEFWGVAISLVTDPTEDLTDETYGGVDWDELVTEEGDTSITFSHTLKLLDEEYWSLEGDDDDYFDNYFSDGGTLTINSHTPGETISGSFEAPVTDDEGGEAGEAKVKFNVERCEDMELDF